MLRPLVSQGLNCAVESVRLFNVVLKVSGDRLERAPMVFSEVGALSCAVLHCAMSSFVHVLAVRRGSTN